MISTARPGFSPSEQEFPPPLPAMFVRSINGRGFDAALFAASVQDGLSPSLVEQSSGLLIMRATLLRM